MSLTNPNKLINVQELAYFEGKIGNKYAAKTALSNKADKVGTGHGDEIALYNSNGNLKTSNKKLSDFADANHNHDSRYYQKSQVYTKQQVDAKISDVSRKYMVTVASHTIVFGGPVDVSNHKVVFF